MPALPDRVRFKAYKDAQGRYFVKCPFCEHVQRNGLTLAGVMDKLVMHLDAKHYKPSGH